MLNVTTQRSQSDQKWRRSSTFRDPFELNVSVHDKVVPYGFDEASRDVFHKHFTVASYDRATKADVTAACILMQGILKGEVSLYHWPPVWLVRNQLYDYWQFLFIFSKQTNPNQSNRRSMVQWYFPFSIFPCLMPCSAFKTRQLSLLQL